MLVRIKYEGKSRKLEGKVNSLTELRSKIGEFFGEKTITFPIVYKDCDGEIVNIIDNEDLGNCYGEAEELKQTSVTFLIKAKNVATRSISSKKSSSSSSFGSDKGMEAPISSSFVDVSKPIPTETTFESEKAKLECEHAKNQSEIDAKKQAKCSSAENNREKGHCRSRSRGKCGERRGGPGLLFKLFGKIKFVKRMMEENSDQQGAESFNELAQFFYEIKKECPGMVMNPQIMVEMLRSSKKEIMKAITSSYSVAVTQNPELVKKAEENLAKWKECREKFGTWGRSDKPCQSPRERGHEGECQRRRGPCGPRPEGFEGECGPWAERRHYGHDPRPKRYHGGEKDGSDSSSPQHCGHRNGGHHRGHHGGHHGGPHGVSHGTRHGGPHQSYDPRPDWMDRSHGPWGGRRHHGHRHGEDRPECTPEHKEFKQKVRSLRETFPNIDKHELKDIVRQNPTVAIDALPELVKNFKKTDGPSKLTKQ